MPCNLNEQELYVIFKVTFNNRWCNKHINVESITGGIPRHKTGPYRKAVQSLVRKGYLKAYHAQGRTDVCAMKHYREFFIRAMDSHREEYNFLERFNAGRIR